MKTFILSISTLVLLASCSKETIDPPAAPAPKPEAPAQIQETFSLAIQSTATKAHTVTLKGAGTITGTIDWGTGTPVPFSGASQVSLTNSYAAAGSYLVAITLTSPAADISELYAGIAEISQVNGLAGLPGLQSVNFHHNLLTSLDLSGNPELTSISVYNNSLTALNLTGNPKLIILSASFNKLNSLDVSENAVMTHLSVPANELTGVNLSHNGALRFIDIALNKFSDAAIDQALIDADNSGVSGNVALFAAFGQNPKSYPTAAGLAVIPSLKAKQWSVTVDQPAPGQ